jgi:hypothetical protein
MVQEHVGIVIRDQRSLTVALPALRRLDRIRVALPGLTTQQEFSVAEVFDQACEQKSDGEFCR